MSLICILSYKLKEVANYYVLLYSFTTSKDFTELFIFRQPDVRLRCGLTYSISNGQVDNF